MKNLNELAAEENGVILLAADTVSGVYQVDSLPEGEDTLSYEVFKDCLSELEDGETLYTYATQEEAQHLDTYYGVTLL